MPCTTDGKSIQTETRCIQCNATACFCSTAKTVKTVYLDDETAGWEAASDEAFWMIEDSIDDDK